MAIVEEGGRTLLPVQDGLGNITAVLDAESGSTVARYEFSPFGEMVGGSGDMDACPFRYQTKWFDAESQHYYFGYRYYDPRMGRWLSRDPLGEAGGFNLYAYCGNDPVNRHDPLGLDPGGESSGYRPAPGWLNRGSASGGLFDAVAPVTAAIARGGRSPYGSTAAAIAHSRDQTMPLLKTVAVAGYST